MSEINATIDRFEGKNAIITVDAERFSLPRTLLPVGCSEGDVIILTLRRNGEQTGEKRQLAKEMLNEILHSDGE